MNTQVNKVLSQLRNYLSEEAAWGPDSEVDETQVSAGEPGELGAQNYATTEDKVDALFAEIIDAMMLEYEVDEETVLEFIFQVAMDAAEEGILPEFPEDDAPESDLLDWYGKAVGVSFKSMVLDAAAESAE